MVCLDLSVVRTLIIMDCIDLPKSVHWFSFLCISNKKIKQHKIQVLYLKLSIFRDNNLRDSYNILLFLPSKHTTSQQRRYNVAATSRRCSDVVTTLFVRCVFAKEAKYKCRDLGKSLHCTELSTGLQVNRHNAKILQCTKPRRMYM